MKKRYKYKRSHFSSDEEYERFRIRSVKAQKRWLKKREDSDPEYRERRILRQRLYSRYYYTTDCRVTFRDWLEEEHGISDISRIQIGDLREIAQKLNYLKISRLDKK